MHWKEAAGLFMGLYMVFCYEPTQDVQGNEILHSGGEFGVADKR